MEIKKIDDLENFEIIFESDKTGRAIKSYLIKDCQFDENKIFYPEVLIYSHNNKELYNPINERILSLEKLSIKKEVRLNLTSQTSIEDSPVFYFIYNTENYYHFIYDTLPYLITFNILKEKVPNLKLLVNYPNYQTNYVYKFVVEFLEIIGLKKHDLLFVDSKKLYKKIYVSSSYTHGIDSNLPPRMEVYDFFKKIVTSKINKFNFNTPKKLYISRRSWKHNDFSNIGTNYTLKRKMSNEDELVNFLLSGGYSEIFTEKLDSLEKLNLFYNAESIVGSIGGGLCNVLFSKPNTKLISIVSPTFLDVNGRFKYSLDVVDTTYFMKTTHIELGEFKMGMRVQCDNLSIVGEIIEVNGNDLTVIYSDSAVAGWNNQIEFKKIIIPSSLCYKLDDGLNSPFSVDIESIKDLIY
jgi:capsular polysaccharide biosynthesis protein